MTRAERGITLGRLVTSTLPAALVVAACGAGDATLYVQVEMDEGRPLSGSELVAIPFDPERLLDSLARTAATPSPRFPDLDAQLLAYRQDQRPVDDGPAEPGWRAIRDSVAALADSLRGRDRRSRAYREAYERLRQLYARLSLRTAARDAEFRREYATDLRLAERARRAADSLRAWERTAYATYPELARRRVQETGRQPWRGTTDASGRIRLSLQAGRWWLTLRQPDPDNPFLEIVWNVPVTVTRLAPVVVPLSRRNATVRWRH